MWHYPTIDLPVLLGSKQMVPFLLKECDSCSQLWLEYWYEPWSAYIHAILWPGTKGQAQLLIDSDYLTLKEWHAGRIYEECKKKNKSIGGMGMINPAFKPVCYEALKTEPNQAPQTTICTVTECAPSSTLRASADRV